MNPLRKRIEEVETQFNHEMHEANSAINNAIEELSDSARRQKVNYRFARMYAYRLQKAVKDLSHAPSLAESRSGGTTKDGGAWQPDLFDDNDGETESERRTWAARDSYDMRDGK